MEEAYHRFALERLEGHDVLAAAEAAGVSRASGFRLERRRVDMVEIADGISTTAIASTRLTVASKREHDLMALWLNLPHLATIAGRMGMSRASVTSALLRLWGVAQLHHVMADLEAQPVPLSEWSAQRCPLCGFRCGYRYCPRCSSPRRRVATEEAPGWVLDAGSEFP